jgi:hypothetical protein
LFLHKNKIGSPGSGIDFHFGLNPTLTITICSF